MTRGIGALFLGAAMMSLFAPASRGQGRGPVRIAGTEPASSAPPIDAPTGPELAAGHDHSPPTRLLALVQTRPQARVLAISESREELERELLELNETWNHWQLRSERQRYEIQPAPVLRRAPEPPVRRHRIAST